MQLHLIEWSTVLSQQYIIACYLEESDAVAKKEDSLHAVPEKLNQFIVIVKDTLE